MKNDLDIRGLQLLFPSFPSLVVSTLQVYSRTLVLGQWWCFPKIKAHINGEEASQGVEPLCSDSSFQSHGKKLGESHDNGNFEARTRWKGNVATELQVARSSDRYAQ